MKNIYYQKISISMKIFLRFIFPAVLMLTLTIAHAQESGRVAGLVLDRVSGDPLPGANIFLEGTTIGASSDMNGEYLIPRVAPGSYNLVVKYIGYKEISVPINVEPGEKVYQLIELEYVAIVGDVIEVTAQARGQIEAINQQLASNTIKNVVSADRIQDIPDANAAESVGRLPGISIVRSGGEGQKVTIRGMAPKYNVMMVNGVRMESTDRDDRSVDLNMIAPNMLSGIEVTKALTADMDADAVGGTVNLKIGKAREGFYKNFSLQGGYGSMADTYGNYRFSGLLSNRFYGDKLGVQLSGFVDRYNRNSDQLSAGYETNEDTKMEGDLIQLYLLNTDIVDNTTERKRSGGGLVLDYHLPFGSLMINSFISSINEQNTRQQNSLNVRNYNWSGYALDQEFTNTVFSNALQGEFKFYNIKMDFSLSSSNTTQRNPGDLTMNIGPQTGGHDMWGDSTLVDDREATPSELLNAYYVYSDARVIMQGLNTLKREVDEGALAGVLNFEVPYTITNWLAGNLKFGGKLEQNTRKNDETRWGLSLNSDIAGVTFIPLLRDSIWTDLGLTVGDGGSVPASLFEDPDYDIGDFLSGKEGVRNNIFYNKLSPSKIRHLEYLAKNTYFLNETDGEYYPYYFFNAQASTQYDYKYTRNFGAFFAMAELNLSKYVTFLPGIRYERYHFKYSADSTYERATQTVLGAQGYNYKTIHWDSTEAETWFPQMQLRVKPFDWLDIRLASTKSIIYPDYRAVSPYIYYSQASTPAFVQLGNPYLKPAITQNYDIYTSVYENYIGLFTAGFFYKEIENLIVPFEFLTRDASKIHNRITLGTGSDTRVRTWTNLEQTSYVRGFELDWQTNFWYLPSYLKGLVLNINYTHIKSESHYPYQERIPVGLFGSKLVDTTRTGRLINQPDDIMNVTLGYDIGGFSARLSFLYQDNLLRSADVRQEELDSYTGAYYRWDFTAYQTLPWLKGLQLYLNVNNLTDRPDRQFRSTLEKLSEVQYYGRTLDLGLRYQF
jgi:TonB-dependent receptor